MNKQECEICGMDWIDNLDDTPNEREKEYESIRQTKKCIHCNEEYGDGWADRDY